MIRVILAITMAVTLAGLADAQTRRDRDRDRDSAASDNPLQMQMRRVSPREAARRAQREEEAREAAEAATSDGDDNAAANPQTQSNAINPPGGSRVPAPRPGGRGTDTNSPQAPGDTNPAPEPSPGGGNGGGSGGHPEAPFDPVETPFAGSGDDNEAAAPVRVRRAGDQRMSGETVDGEPVERQHRRARDRRRNTDETTERTRVRDNRTRDDD